MPPASGSQTAPTRTKYFPAPNDDCTSAHGTPCAHRVASSYAPRQPNLKRKGEPQHPFELIEHDDPEYIWRAPAVQEPLPQRMAS